MDEQTRKIDDAVRAGLHVAGMNFYMALAGGYVEDLQKEKDFTIPRYRDVEKEFNDYQKAIKDFDENTKDYEGVPTIDKTKIDAHELLDKFQKMVENMGEAVLDHN